jgi:hypothetical protein
MSSALLSVLLVCNRRISTQTSREIQQHVMFILIGPHVSHFSDGNQTVCPTVRLGFCPRALSKISLSTQYLTINRPVASVHVKLNNLSYSRTMIIYNRIHLHLIQSFKRQSTGLVSGKLNWDGTNM